MIRIAVTTATFLCARAKNYFRRRHSLERIIPVTAQQGTFEWPSCPSALFAVDSITLHAGASRADGERRGRKIFSPGAFQTFTLGREGVIEPLERLQGAIESERSAGTTWADVLYS